MINLVIFRKKNLNIQSLDREMKMDLIYWIVVKRNKVVYKIR